MPYTIPKSDTERDAKKYRTWSLALEKALETILELEQNQELTIENVLENLLPYLAQAVDAQKAFIAKYEESHNDREWLQVRATYPKDDILIEHLPLSDMLHTLIKEGSPKVVDPLGAEYAQVIAGLEPLDATSTILVRVKILENVYVVGVCNKQDYNSWPFLASDRMVISNLLEIVAVGIRAGERKRLALSRLRKTLNAISSELELDKLLELIVQETATALESEAVTIMRWDSSEEKLIVAAQYGLSLDYEKRQQVPRAAIAPLLPSDGRYGPIVINLSTESYGNPELIESERLTSVLCAPLVDPENQLIGTLTVHSRDTARQFSTDDETLAQTIADSTSIAIHNAERYKRRVQERKTIQAIGEAIIGISEEDVWQTITQNAVELFSAKYAALKTFDSSENILRGVGTHFADERGWQEEKERILLLDNNSANGRVALAQKPEYVLDVQNSTSLLDSQQGRFEDEGIISAFCLPLIMKKQLMGTLFVAFDRSVDFDQKLIQNRIALLSPQASIALYNAELMRKIEEQRQIQKKAIEIQTYIADVSDLDKEMAQIRETLDNEFDCSGFSIAFYDEDSGEIEIPQVYVNNKPALPAEMQIGGLYSTRKFGDRNGLIDYVIKTRKSLLIKDFISDPRSEKIDFEYRQDIKSCLIVPIFRYKRFIGALGLRSYRASFSYNEYDRELLETLASHIATVLDNARQYQQQIDDLEAVSEFQREISGLNVLSEPIDTEDSKIDFSKNAVEREIIDIHDKAQKAMKKVGLPTGEIFLALLDESREYLEYPLVYEEGEPINLNTQSKNQNRAYGRRRLGSYRDLSDWMIGKDYQEPLLLNTRQEIKDWIKQQSEAIELPGESVAWLGAALVVRGKPIGVIGARSFQTEDCFQPNHGNLLKTIAQQTAVAIDNARLYERLRQNEQANKIAVMGAWGAEIVHDVNREISHIDANVVRIDDLFNERENANLEIEKLNQYLAEIEESLKQMTLPELPERWVGLGEVMTIANAPPIDEVIMAEISETKKSELRPVSRTLINFRTQLQCPDCHVAMPVQWLQRILRHFIQNAIRYMPDHRKKAFIEIRTFLQDKMICVEIEDNGKGIRENIQNQLFRQPIKSEKQTGRGLLLVDFAVRSYGGAVKLVQSEIDVGTIFEFQIPQVKEEDK